MKRKSLGVGLLFLVSIFVLSSFNIKDVLAQNDRIIQNVDHQIEVLFSGTVVISDTVTLSGQGSGTFLIGFPYRYGSYILKGVAFDKDGTLPIDLGVQLGNRSGFYGTEVDLSDSTNIFTVIFILSNELLSETASGFSLDFPIYPSFVRDVNRCNVTLKLPAETSNVSISKLDGNITATNFVKENLSAFSYSPAIATFSLPGAIQKIDIKSLNRLVTVYPGGEIRVEDDYRLTNNSSKPFSYLRLDLPSEASNVYGKDEFGRTLSVITADNGATKSANVTLISSISIGQTVMVTIEYNLPNTAPKQTTHFTFDLDLFPVTNYFVDDASVQIVPPEGAHFTTPQLYLLASSLSVNRELFQENLEIRREGVSYVDRSLLSETVLHVEYEYNPLWLSFRPTLEVWALCLVGSIIFMIWRRPKTGLAKRAAVPRLSAGLSPDNIRAFTEAYEERRRIIQELRLLHARAQKGKIPRNYYKSQRKNLELRVNALTKNINQLKETLRNAKGTYGDLLRQLETAESELGKARAKVRSTEARHRTGELPIEEYKKALAEYQEQKEKLEQQINGILLRLREEIR